MSLAIKQISAADSFQSRHHFPDNRPLFGETHFIINPAAAAGRTEKRWLRLLSHLRKTGSGDFTYSLTAYPGQGYRIARLAVAHGCQLIGVMGGDGTIQEVVNGLFQHGQSLNPRVRLAILNSGTGQGLARSLGLPETPEEQLALIGRGAVRQIDLARVTFRGGDDRLHRRVFVNECQIGIGGRVVERLHGGAKRLGGFLAFGMTALRTALRYPAHSLDMVLDDTRPIRQSVLGVVIANGAVTGGGMRLTPLARLDDGWLDVLLIHSQSFFQRLRNFPKIYSGNHIHCPAFTYLRVKQITINGSAEVPIAADGEFLGHLPCTVTLLPKALSVIAPTEGEQS